ncbi:MAG: hypothetical protein COZ12_02325 [Deltaproteobacteria bacterium CG_4_10_14_3_um_filter_60_8]|nr:MAG: hypothetical protein AUK28_01990 [Desulfobacterales bacterium CG2_30_60_27]PIP44403.1 MAG: hypothetical protein COX17_01605 [Deltaproteobacteria bacterium CG23_combo_of_CG06-09_8_20_14_all_60_8]PIY23084.1 MAG: hypothetical protein COZ12_02325 [Deltaproteobacteria bacterium CG_4_10_14_3_um_filter_60_8]
MSKTRINISLDQDLADFAKIFAAENRTSVADVITQYLLSLKRRVEGQSTEKILSHPAFGKAMEEAQAKLRNGTAQWHSYDEVFGD